MSNSETNPKASILVVDDYPDNLRMLSLILQAEGYRVRKATSGAMALKTIEFQLPDLILLDIRMPEMDGFAVCATLKRSSPTCDVPILFISASDDINDKVTAFEIGGSDYITKPFRDKEVLARVRYQLTIRQQQQSLVTLYQQVQHLNTHLEEQVQERTQELQLALEKVQRLNTLKDDFLSTISHELRTPIANIRVVLQLLMTASRHGKDFFQTLSDADAKETPSNKITQYLKILQDECDRELNLIQDLLDLQQVTADNLPLEPTSIDLQNWIPYLAETFATRAQKQQQTLVINLAPNLPPLQTNTSSLDRIVTELLTNACKYTPAGGTITVDVTGEQGTIMISVSNSGIEIPGEELPHVFDKFYRIPSNDPWKHGGTGLGLALVKKLTEYLQGSIEVTSANNLTCFTVTLPNHQTP